LAIGGDKVTVMASNNGQRRLRISALNLRDANGKTISFGPGLAGIVRDFFFAECSF